jgi:multiple sugar transport system ATP-binding protein
MSLLPAAIEPDGARIAVAGQHLRFPGTPAGPLRRYLGRPVVLGVRPEHVHLVPPGDAPDGLRTLRLTVARVEHLGSEIGVACVVAAPAVAVPDAGEPLGLGDSAMLYARVPVRTDLRRGGPIEVEIEVSELSFFDPDTGAALWHPA